MKFKYVYTMLALMLALNVLGGCGSTTGNDRLAKMNEQDICTKIVKGKTTSEEVRLCLGEPTDVDFDNKNRKKWIYNHTKSTLTAISYVPYANLISSGTNDLTKKLVIVFDEKDRVMDFITTESKGKTNTGLVR